MLSTCPILVLFCYFLLAAAASSSPTFNKLYDGTLLFDQREGLIPGAPFGDRLLLGFIGGNLTDPSTGAVVASVVPGLGGELGTVIADGTVFTDVTVVLQWADDGKYAYVDVRGVGSLAGQASGYARLETDSPSRVGLRSVFLLTQVDLTVEPVVYAIYQLDG